LPGHSRCYSLGDLLLVFFIITCIFRLCQSIACCTLAEVFGVSHLLEGIYMVAC
jgi:hypothetical protein